jgi:hypothetical protein
MERMAREGGETGIGGAPPERRGPGRPRGSKKVNRRRRGWALDADVVEGLEAEVGVKKWKFCEALNQWLRGVLAEKRAAREEAGKAG